MNVGFCGLGKLGLPVALAVESRGHRVFGHDANPAVAGYLAKRAIPFVEEGIQPLLDNTKIKLVGAGGLVEMSDIIFCAVQTPHQPRFEGVTRLPKERKDFDYSYLISAVKELSTQAAKQRKNIVLAVISTCLPGTFEREIKPLLNQHVNYAYSPLYIAMGTVIGDYLNPEYALIGTSDETAARRLGDFFKTIHDKRQIVTDIATAEAIKVFYNTAITSKIILANVHMQVAHKMGLNIDDINAALMLATDRIVSTRYMRSGGPDSGGCFPAGELVMTKQGMRPIENIEPGTDVLTSDGSFHKVVKRWERDYNGCLVSVTARGLPPTRMTGDHPVIARIDGRKLNNFGHGVKRDKWTTNHRIIDKIKPIKEVRADELIAGHLVGWPKIGFNEYDSLAGDFLKLAGWYLSEGSADLSKTHGRLRFDLHKREFSDAQDIERWLLYYAHDRPNGRGANVKISHKVDGNSRSIIFGNLGLTRELVDRFGKGASNKKIPPEVLWGTKREAMAILWGLMRGDGHRSEQGVSYSTTSPDLAWGVFVLLHKLGLNPSLRDMHPRGMHKRAFEVRVRNRRLANKLCEVVGWEPYGCDKEIKTYADDGKTVWRHIWSLNKEKFSGKVYNLWVEGNHTYVVGCGAVHNCHPRDLIALSWLGKQIGLSPNWFEMMAEARELQTEWTVGLVAEKHKETGLPVFVLGRSFKPGTNIETGSGAVLFANLLQERGISPVQYDPRVDAVAPQFVKGIYFVATEHQEFKNFRFPAGSIVFDLWRFIPETPGVQVIPIGKPARPTGAAPVDT